ncbi:hypothetical protein S7335_3121 [Synechococcus sp. PCC 7335]|uniref:hypothetical protein n=1 Tax=Synechococcus sp. (strain ATCC 29403 / PCC 7335) TaxID=91464 RepID=UPI00017ED1F4|nr:hypothetical protein [Synechococcus sp. PCC 7335]EDX85420.1 hypothetical protein S7335_3121 [Synechococcus sp. PCC 7335]
MNEQQEKNLTAFLTALSEQEDSLPAGLQAQLTSIGQNLEARVMELPAIAASIPSLNQAYQTALSDANGDSGPKATLVSSTSRERSTDISERAAQILTDADPVQAAKKKMSPSIGQIASNPLKRLFGRG